MASTYAAVGYAGQLDAQPQSNYEVPTGGSTPTQAEFNAFADAMSTSYGAPIGLFAIDPLNGTETLLADTSVTNLLAELPVLETEANGVNLGLQLADGTQVQFASTAGTATFLYSLAVQQMQATSFVTDNYNLDMQWLNTVDQPLLQEAVFWSERAAGEASVYPERTIEDNTQASLALQIAAEAPSSRQDMSVTIHNAETGNPTQITVYADGDGGRIHDVAPSIFSIIESVVSTLVDIAAVVTGQDYLYYAAAAIDTAEAGQAFANGQDLAGILSVAQALSAGITGAAGGTTPLGSTPTAPPSTALVTLPGVLAGETSRGARFARSVVLATGFGGVSSLRVPLVIATGLPADRWDHACTAFDLTRFRGKRIGVLGHGVSAFDAAVAALQEGAARVDLCFRRAALPEVNPHRHLDAPGMMAHWT